jgi:hypothetical protein
MQDEGVIDGPQILRIGRDDTQIALPCADRNRRENAVESCTTGVLAGYSATYAELIHQLTEIPWPPGDHASGQLGYLLGQVSLEELDVTEDRPVISSVVRSSRNEPSQGYWGFVERDLAIRVPTSRREEFWLEEMNRCFAVYGEATLRGARSLPCL